MLTAGCEHTWWCAYIEDTDSRPGAGTCVPVTCSTSAARRTELRPTDRASTTATSRVGYAEYEQAWSDLARCLLASTCLVCCCQLCCLRLSSEQHAAGIIIMNETSAYVELAW